jgi:hypothetical protein
MPLGLLENSAKGVDNSSLRPRFKVKYMQWMECMIRNKFLACVLGELLFLDHAGFEFFFSAWCLVGIVLLNLRTLQSVLPHYLLPKCFAFYCSTIAYFL